MASSRYFAMRAISLHMARAVSLQMRGSNVPPQARDRACRVDGGSSSEHRDAPQAHHRINTDVPRCTQHVLPVSGINHASCASPPASATRIPGVAALAQRLGICRGRLLGDYWNATPRVVVQIFTIEFPSILGGLL
ncbi:hypothetical protein EV715DRAFT_298206 [Schizophyllum commune]